MKVGLKLACREAPVRHPQIPECVIAWLPSIFSPPPHSCQFLMEQSSLSAWARPNALTDKIWYQRCAPLGLHFREIGDFCFFSAEALSCVWEVQASLLDKEIMCRSTEVSTMFLSSTKTFCLSSSAMDKNMKSPSSVSDEVGKFSFCFESHIERNTRFGISRGCQF